MVLNSSILLLLKSLATTMLLLTDTKILLAYMAGDHLLHLLLKLARGDFLHWLPVDGAGGLALSLLMRVGSKTIADFAGVLQFRGPLELGGY